MKKITLLSILALLLCVVSCQISNVDGVLTDDGFKVTAVIDNSDATRVTYAVDNETAFTITPTWSVGDKIIGIDDKDQKFTFTVESVSDGVATLNAGTYTGADAHQLFAFYAPGVTESDIQPGSLNVPLDTQDGTLNNETPVVMSASAEVTGSGVVLNFVKQTAIVGLKKFKLPKEATITSMDLNGVSTSLAFTWNYEGLKVASGETGSINLKGNWAADAEGVCTTPVYFSVAPQKNAQFSISMSTGTEQFVNVAQVAALNIEAGYYYHMTKEMGGPAVTVNGTGYATLEEAFAAASKINESVVITLQRDVTPTGLCNFFNPDNKEVNVLDLNGHNITTASANLINIKDSGLHITDNSTNDPAAWGVITTAKASSTSDYVVVVSGTANVVLVKGTITATGCRGLNLTGGPTVHLDGGKVESTSGIAVGVGSSGGTLYVAGDVKINGSGNVVYLWGGTATFSGGFITNGKTSAPIYANDGATVWFSDGYVNTPNINTVAAAAGGHAYVVGGYHSCAVRDVYAKAEDAAYYNVLNTNEETAETYPYHVVPASSYPLYATVISGTNVWNHAELASAVKQADLRSKNTAATTLKLQSEANTNTTIAFRESHKYMLTLDLNGQRISSGALPAVQAQCPMTIVDATGQGEIYTTGAIAVRSTANLTINGGSYVSCDNAIVATDTCDLVINAGYFYGDDSYDVRRTSETASITINGGRFRKALDASTIAQGCEATAEELVYNGRTYNYKVAAAAVVATVNGTGYATLESAVVALNAIPADAGRATLILQEDIANASPINITNTNVAVALDLNGHVLSSTSASLIQTSGQLNILDSSREQTGKITSSEGKVIHMTANNAQLVINGCTIESTKTEGSAWNKDAVVYLESNKTTQVFLYNAKIIATKKLSAVINYYSTLTITGSEISSGTESTGWYALLTVCGATTVNSVSSWTSGTGNASTCHIADGEGSVIVNDGYFYSNGRAVSAGNTSYAPNIVLKGGYYNMARSNDAITVEEGKTFSTIDPKVTHVHTTTGATLEYGYQVK